MLQSVYLGQSCRTYVSSQPDYNEVMANEQHRSEGFRDQMLDTSRVSCISSVADFPYNVASNRIELLLMIQGLM
jgi:hypothetical protein